MYKNDWMVIIYREKICHYFKVRDRNFKLRPSGDYIFYIFTNLKGHPSH